MPGKQVKNWDLYHKLRAEGKDKTTAAKIANSASGPQQVADEILDRHKKRKKK